MRRRTLLSGLGSTFTAAGLAIGSGAFTTIEANRGVAIDVRTDADGFLSISTGFGAELQGNSDELTLVIDENIAPGAEGEGVGVDSIYEFGDRNRPVFVVKNNGTNAVKLYGKSLAENVGITLLAVDQDGLPGITYNSPSRTINPGKSISIGLRVETFGIEKDDIPNDGPLVIDEGFRLVAKRPDQFDQTEV